MKNSKRLLLFIIILGAFNRLSSMEGQREEGSLGRPVHTFGGSIEGIIRNSVNEKFEKIGHPKAFCEIISDFTTKVCATVAGGVDVLPDNNVEDTLDSSEMFNADDQVFLTNAFANEKFDEDEDQLDDEKSIAEITRDLMQEFGMDKEAAVEKCDGTEKQTKKKSLNKRRKKVPSPKRKKKKRKVSNPKMFWKAHIPTRGNMMNIWKGYKCDCCRKGFITEKEFNDHKESHRGDVRSFTIAPQGEYKCEECGTFYISQSNLDKHNKRTHEGPKGFKCEFPGCGKEYVYESVLENHQKKCKFYPLKKVIFFGGK